MKLSAKLAKTKYDHTQDSITHLLVELEAPKVEWKKERAPICVIPVLDVSGSMAGEKLDYVQKACRKFIDHLSVGDFLGIVAFDTQVHEVAPIVEINQYQKDVLKKKVTELYANSCTYTSGGLATAFKWIKEMNLPENVILRVILFTDGHANNGITGRDLLDFVKEHKGKASLSVFGFGNDCNQELLSDMTTVGEGNFAYIDSPDAALSAFARELGGLMSTYGQNIEVRITPGKGNEIVEVLNDEDVKDENGIAVIQLRDILGEEKKWVVAKVKLQHVEKAFPRKVKAFEIDINYKDKDANLKTLKQLPVKMTFCKVGEESKEEDTEVVRQRDRLLAAKAQEQAEAFARVGNYAQASYTIQKCAYIVCDAGVKDVLGTVSSYYSSPISYTANSGLTNSIKKKFRSSRDISFLKDCQGANLCATAGGPVKSSAMDDMEESFLTDDGSINISVTDGTSISVTNTSASKERSGKDW